MVFEKGLGLHMKGLGLHGVWRRPAAVQVKRHVRRLGAVAAARNDVRPAYDKPIVVESLRDAEKFLEDVKSAPKDAKYGCDTEVEIDLKTQSPVENGKVTCISVYVGHDGAFEEGKRAWWIDVLDGEPGLMDAVKPFFESHEIGKIWHNYSFDRHCMYNHGIDCHGLGGDTMHMARIWNSSLDKLTGQGGYSLASLSARCLKRDDMLKTKMIDLFGKGHLLKNGKESKVKTLPPVPEIQRSDSTRDDWIKYSCVDAMCTAELYHFLRGELSKRRWHPLGSKTPVKRDDGSFKTMWNLYEELVLPFATVLTDIEREGFQIDTDYLEEIQGEAEQEVERLLFQFKEWTFDSGSFKTKEDAMEFNPSSTSQKQFLFFAKGGILCPSKKVDSQRKKLEKEFAALEDEAAKVELAKKIEKLKPKEASFKTLNTIGFIEEGKKAPLKNREVVVKGLGLPVNEYSPTGWPKCSSSIIEKLSGRPDDGVYGTAESVVGKEGCHAIDALNKANAVEKLLSTFIIPLQERVDSHNRIHASLNLNTETGRLSSRNPNLQNQPALEKDIYKIRSAFKCKEGNKLIVADYGQLELRVLAHLCDCVSMIDAFEKGGDFHSRTAMGMYPKIKEMHDKGEVYLEWDYAENGGKEPDKPLIKNLFSSERRKAKVLNFSIAYGKTAVGLSKDFNVSLEEAEETLNLWYADRPEVRSWQQKMRQEAHRTMGVRTLWGRRRLLPGVREKEKFSVGAAERAAINTPIQGSAADIVMAAMLKVHRNEILRRLGWRMILQVHDEIILEGPEESAEEALQLLLADMEDPLDFRLKVDLVVDASIADTWYEGK